MTIQRVANHQTIKTARIEHSIKNTIDNKIRIYRVDKTIKINIKSRLINAVGTLSGGMGGRWLSLPHFSLHIKN